MDSSWDLGSFEGSRVNLKVSHILIRMGGIEWTDRNVDLSYYPISTPAFTRYILYLYWICYYPYCYPYPKFGVAAMKSNPIRDQVETSSGRMPKTWFNLWFSSKHISLKPTVYVAKDVPLQSLFAQRLRMWGQEIVAKRRRPWSRGPWILQCKLPNVGDFFHDKILDETWGKPLAYRRCYTRPLEGGRRGSSGPRRKWSNSDLRDLIWFTLW